MHQTTPPCKYSGFKFEEFRSALTIAALADLQAAFEPVSFGPDTVIFDPRTGAERVLLIESGCVTVSDAHDHREQMEPASPAAGRIFGLMEVLSGAPHRVGLKAATDVKGWSLPSDKAIELLRKHPQLCLRVLTLVASVYNESLSHHINS